MSLWTRRWVRALSLVALLVASTSSRVARAGEEDDLQRQIETQRGGVSDIERLDELHAAGDEIALLKAWLDEAWALRAKHEYDDVRAVLDRALAQAELIRQKIAASKLRAQADKREAALQATRHKIDQARKALADTAIRKKVLEAGSK
ncbi:MAG TPA: hypothetical protein VG319_00095 [Polyangia bacterium]|nr:hypothetical protein [Polyangia bacterium]